MPHGSFRLADREVTVDDTGPRLPDGKLAGSILRLDAGVRNPAAATGRGVETALSAATTVPARLLGLPDRGRIAPGARADLTILTRDFDAVGTLVGGELVWAAPAARPRGAGVGLRDEILEQPEVATRFLRDGLPQVRRIADALDGRELDVVLIAPGAPRSRRDLRPVPVRGPPSAARRARHAVARVAVRIAPRSTGRSSSASASRAGRPTSSRSSRPHVPRALRPSPSRTPPVRPASRGGAFDRRRRRSGARHGRHQDVHRPAPRGRRPRRRASRHARCAIARWLTRRALRVPRGRPGALGRRSPSNTRRPGSPRPAATSTAARSSAAPSTTPPRESGRSSSRSSRRSTPSRTRRPTSSTVRWRSSNGLPGPRGGAVGRRRVRPRRARAPPARGARGRRACRLRRSRHPRRRQRLARAAAGLPEWLMPIVSIVPGQLFAPTSDGRPASTRSALRWISKVTETR